MRTSGQAHPLIPFSVAEKKCFHVLGATAFAACRREGGRLAWEPLEPCKLRASVPAGSLLVVGMWLCCPLRVGGKAGW